MVAERFGRSGPMASMPGGAVNKDDGLAVTGFREVGVRPLKIECGHLLSSNNLFYFPPLTANSISVRSMPMSAKRWLSKVFR